MSIEPSMSILVVDDYNTMTRIITGLLHQLGLKRVDTATGGASALAKMREKRYDLVLSDWNMSPMTCYDLLRAMRADPKLCQIRFIMVTAESKADNHGSRS